MEGTTVSEEVDAGGMQEQIAGRRLRGFGGGCGCWGHWRKVELRDSRGSGAGYV